MSVGPLWSREDWTTDWTIYFCKDTSVSNHSISRRLYRTRTHAQLFLIETLLLVNRQCCICVCGMCVNVPLYIVFPQNVSYALMSGWHLVKWGKKMKARRGIWGFFSSSQQAFSSPETQTNTIQNWATQSFCLLFFTAVITPYAAQFMGWGGLLAESADIWKAQVF